MLYAIAAPAKINLSLAITGKRDDGYHDLHSHVIFADIYDHLIFTPAAADSIHIDGDFAPAILGGENLILKTLRLARGKSPQLPHYAVHLTKSIPVGAGLGGGSADAAATIRFLREWHADIFARCDWIDLARQIGADVAVCIESRPAMMRGIGDIIDPIDSPNPYYGILLYPGLIIATPPVFAALDGVFSPPQPPATGHNDLYCAAATLHPQLADIHAAIERKIKPAAFGLSGSGSCFFMLANDAHEQNAILRRAKSIFPDYWIRPFRAV